jgi:hypothetical protein
MLQICIHDRNDGRRCGQHSFNACRCQSAPTNALHDTDAWVSLCELPHHNRRTIGRVIVNEEYLPPIRAKNKFQPTQQFWYVLGLVESGNYD